MKTNLIVLAPLTLGLLFLFSCQKDNANQPAFSTKVKTYIEDAYNTSLNARDTFDVSYDTKDRILGVISKNGTLQFLYNYNLNSSYTIEIRNGNHLIIRQINFINSDLLVDSSFQFNDTNDSTTQKFLYNANKSLLQEKLYDYSLVTGTKLFRMHDYVYDSKGNALTNTERSPNGSANIITSYTYSNLLTPIFSLATIYNPLPYKNLPDSKTVLYPSSGTSLTVYYTYTFDAYNRIVAETQTINQHIEMVKKYIYY
ncbi:MAG: hypothetical protein H7Y86_01755 [Rhizobacter sp.]|nr:hypothetical protein [Ferruginibacter sp.]